MPKFADIDKLTRPSNFRSDVDWVDLERVLERYCSEKRSTALDLDPDFQRGHVWTKKEQRAYVEYVLRGGSSGKEILFNCPGWGINFRGPFVLVDGKQRLNAVRCFLNNRIKAFGHYYREYTDRLPSHCTFTFHINDLPTRALVLRWYIELNSSGVPHTQAELARVVSLYKAELALEK
jgi:uncharacterized protein with ParB-like and HNH nuclease domain